VVESQIDAAPKFLCHITTSGRCHSCYTLLWLRRHPLFRPSPPHSHILEAFPPGHCHIMTVEPIPITVFTGPFIEQSDRPILT